MMKRWVRVVLTALPGAAAAAIWLWCCRTPEMRSIPAGTEAERLAFLASCGMEGILAGTQHVTVPGEDAAFARYAALQKIQRLPLAAHTGEQGTVYTYAVADSSLRVELLCAGDVLIGAQMYLPEEAQGMPLSSRIRFSAAGQCSVSSATGYSADGWP